ncbi:chemotaxis protein CheW [Pelagibius litoralis]|uniref:Chemotaxis protein CheW n=1 Tax=Pelagibius litoralis TaxID=374515 RepID=A0A967EY02_9PROT|nr:chemotaxis protein CheW [Pelagibius litoralis]NIA69498.1 chemotaxis protein CheW [Pelagibius litoralis]
MSNESQDSGEHDEHSVLANAFSDAEDFVTFVIADQLFGIPVLKVQDVLSAYNITRIPLAPPEIAGSLNLRGRIVTAMDVRLRLGLPPKEGRDSMSIVAEHDGELYSLMVDSVGEVLALKSGDYERNPPTLDPKFRDYSVGIYRLDAKLLVVLDVNRLLDYSREQAA